jgi:hypothetical protein
VKLESTATHWVGCVRVAQVVSIERQAWVRRNARNAHQVRRRKLAAQNVNQFHLDRTVGTEKYASASMDSFALVLIRISQRAKLDATRRCQDLFLAFHVHPEHLQVLLVVWNVSTAPMVIFKINQRNRFATKSKMVKS